MLITLINNADTVKIACLAQLVNTIAPIMTEPKGRAWMQTTYYPFLFTSLNGRGTALKPQTDVPFYSSSGEKVPFVDCAAVLGANADELTLFLVNKNLEEDIACETALFGASFKSAIKWVTLCGYAPDAANTADLSPVRPVYLTEVALGKNSLSCTLPKASWNMLRLKLKD
jgi:alpha-N-arabinofuranosidase